MIMQCKNIILLVILLSITYSSYASSTSDAGYEIAAHTNILKLGNGFSNNVINTAIYRHHGLVTFGNYQFSAFYTNSETIRIVRRDILVGASLHFDLVGKYDITDSHNIISIGLDNRGYLHISYGQHGNRLRYRRTKFPLDITEWTDEISMTGVKENHVTYPMFLNAGQINNRLLFVYRDGVSGKGDICIKEYDETYKKWRDFRPCLLNGTKHSPWTSNAYLNHPAIDSLGRIHFSYVWRTHFLGKDKILNNIGIDYAVTEDWGWTWKTSLGKEYRLPITQVNSETVYAVSPGNNLINQASSAVDSKDNLHIVFYSNDFNGIPQYQHVWFDGKKWRHSFLSKRSNKFLLRGGGSLDIPISRPEVVIDNNDRLYLIYRGDLSNNKMAITRFQPPNYDLKSSSTRILWDKDVGYAEPIIDRPRWNKDNILSMFIQKSGKASNRDISTIQTEPAYIVDWDIVNNW